MTRLSILSGGAAHALVGALSADFTRRTGHVVDGVFGAVGAMRAKLAAGHPADLVILTQAIVAELAASGEARPDAVADVGAVEAAIAVRAGDPRPELGDPDALRRALRAADAIYVPDPALATAGIHFSDVLRRLGLAQELASRLRPHPNGAAAMRALAAAPEARPIGSTQVTEILAEPGAELVAPLPDGYGLRTVYTAAVTTQSRDPEAARALLALLSGEDSAAVRRHCGFL
ncbi:substrate-binding domain-containing protein [Alsobacter sp. KACC 23698]|uniref:Substrate-binding domain-containing protein n=1 Tax=Alsobacter sp. KACC 23698 TaxID=3149229 RepID=A0AAU7JLY3_9HYPH